MNKYLFIFCVMIIIFLIKYNFFLDTENMDDLVYSITNLLNPIYTYYSLVGDDAYYNNDLLEEENHARELGIQGVPCFIFNKKYVIFGVQNKKKFIAVIKNISNEF